MRGRGYGCELSVRSQLSGLISASRFKCGITERVDVGWGCTMSGAWMSGGVGTMLGVWMSDNGLGCWVGGCRVGGGCREDAALKSWQLLWSLAGFRPFLNSQVSPCSCTRRERCHRSGAS